MRRTLRRKENREERVKLVTSPELDWVPVSPSPLAIPSPNGPLQPPGRESLLIRNHSDYSGQWASAAGVSPGEWVSAKGNNDVEKRTKGTGLSVLLGSGKTEVASQSWIWALWRGIDFSVCTKSTSWYPRSAVEGEVTPVALLPRWGSCSPSESHSSEGWSQTDGVQMVALPVISYGTLGQPFILSEFHCPCWKTRKGAQCGGVGCTQHTGMSATLTLRPSALETSSVQRPLREEKAKTFWVWSSSQKRVLGFI